MSRLSLKSGQGVAWQYRLGLLVVAVVILGVLFRDGLGELVKLWGDQEEFSHAFMLPFIAAFLAWQRRDELVGLLGTGHWSGVVLTLAGVAIGQAGALGTIYLVVHYAILITLVGLLVTFFGFRGLRLLWAVPVLLFFAIPLPPFLNNALSVELQLISSQLGVAIIRLFGISVFLEGNVIDLGTYKLQVVEACNGLRYLFPLLSVAFLVAYFFRVPLWQRLLLFLSSIPLTILMNSLRIGIIGVMVEYYGLAMAEGFVHDFEGWVLFMVCTVLLLLEAWLLVRLFHGDRSLWDVFYIDYDAGSATSGALANTQHRTLAPVYGALVILSVGVVTGQALAGREALVPTRQSFADFPTELEGWQGRTDYLEPLILDALKLDDYIVVEYSDKQGEKAILYAAYYGSQASGESAHSPRSCIPGGGWKIREVIPTRVALDDHRSITVNRVAIQRGDDRRLLYYWFQQRGRHLTNEYLVKWFIFWDALTLNRTDGALVRFSTHLKPNEDWTKAGQRLSSLVRAAAPQLDPFIPGRDTERLLQPQVLIRE